LRGIIFVIKPPSVSTPKDSVVTSRRTISETIPNMTPDYTAAPKATTSSGFIVVLVCKPKSSFTTLITAGIHELPPTMIASFMSSTFKLASFNEFFTGKRHQSINSEVAFSKSCTEIGNSTCKGPLGSKVKKGKDIFVCDVADS